MRCEICDSYVLFDMPDYVEGFVSESRHWCPNGCWSLDYCCGAYRETVGRDEYVWTWEESADDMLARMDRRIASVADAVLEDVKSDPSFSDVC